MSQVTMTRAVEQFTSWSMYVLMLLVAVLVLVGLVNAVIVMWRTLGSREARGDDGCATGAPASGIISMYTYLHLLADVLLVVVGIELIETFLAFQGRANPAEYLTGVLGAALVALARRIIVFFNPESSEPRTGEMYAYAALVVALAFAYGVIRWIG